MTKRWERQWLNLRPTALVFAVALSATGCNLASSVAAAEPVYSETPFHASDFVDPRVGANVWLPLVPGTQWVREGTTLIGNRVVPNLVVTTVTDVTREIQGVTTVLVYDHSVGAGQVVQESLDYLAQDKDGNIWMMGGATEQYEAGRYVAVDEAWISGKDGSQAGILMPADPPASAPWVIDKHAGEEDSVAEFVQLLSRKCEPFDCFSKVLVTREGKATAIDNEFKYYAYGVGQIDNQPRGASRHQDIEQLINITRLSPEGLAEASAASLRIDRRAEKEWPELFGSVKASRSPYVAG